MSRPMSLSWRQPLCPQGVGPPGLTLPSIEERAAWETGKAKGRMRPAKFKRASYQRLVEAMKIEVELRAAVLAPENLDVFALNVPIPGHVSGNAELMRKLRRRLQAHLMALQCNVPVEGASQNPNDAELQRLVAGVSSWHGAEPPWVERPWKLGAWVVMAI